MEPRKNPPPRQVGKIVIIGAFIFSLLVIAYYLYHSFSVDTLKQEYRGLLLQTNQNIITEIEDTVNKGEPVNINRIIEPYLKDKIDFLVVYNLEGEIIQVFTKKGISREKLTEIDRIYRENQEAITNIFFLESAPSSPFSTPIEDGGDTSLLIVTVISPRNIPNRYLLIYNSDAFLNERASLDKKIQKNTFYSLLILVGVIAAASMLIAIKSRQQKLIPAPIPKSIGYDPSTAKHPGNEKTPDLNPQPETSALPNPFTDIKIEDNLEHDEEDVFFKEDDLWEEEKEHPPPYPPCQISRRLFSPPSCPP